MFRFLYGCALRIYVLLIRIASPLNPKAKKWITGRKNLLREIRQHLNGTDKLIWFHVASLGEFEQGRPLMEAIRKKHPGKKILLTFFSPSGYEVRKDYPDVDHVYYLPIDTSRKMRAFLDAVNPESLFIIKYEFWFNLFNELKKRDIKLYLVAGFFRPGQYFFRWWGKWFLKNLHAISWFFLQDTRSQELLKNHGFSNITVCGDTRFDRVARIAQSDEAVVLPNSFPDGSPVIVAGSTWPPDENCLSAAIKHFPEVKWIIAPHQVDEAHVHQLMKLLPVGTKKWSEKEIPDGTRIMVVDSIGLLNRLYRYATIAYIGGGFGKGIHNVLEAAVYGCPVVFGPNYRISREAHDLIRMGGGFSINREEKLLEIFNALLFNKEMYNAASEAAREYVKSGLGATEIILEKTGYS